MAECINNSTFQGVLFPTLWGASVSQGVFTFRIENCIIDGMLALLLLFANSGAIDPAKELPSQERCQSMCGVDMYKITELKK